MDFTQILDIIRNTEPAVVNGVIGFVCITGFFLTLESFTAPNGGEVGRS